MLRTRAGVHTLALHGRCEDDCGHNYGDRQKSDQPHARHAAAAIHHPPIIPLAPTGPLYAGTGANRRRVLPATIGPLGRDTVRTPGEWSQDFSLIREFRLKEKLRFQLCGEAFNVFNHTNFNGPDVGLNIIATTVNGQDAAVFNSPNFGLITSAKAPRFLQLVARMEF